MVKMIGYELKYVPFALFFLKILTTVLRKLLCSLAQLNLIHHGI
jgi:hypothetical protein